MAPADLADTSATAGGVLQLVGSAGKRISAILSVMHQYRTSVDAKVLDQGCKPGDMPGPDGAVVKAMSPSVQDRTSILVDLDAKIKVHRQRRKVLLNQPKNVKTLTRFERELKTFEEDRAMVDSHDGYAGALLACSSLGPLDRSLTQLAPSHTIDNALPGGTQFAFRRLPADIGQYEYHDGVIPGIVDSIEAGDVVFKNGCSTGVTVGVVNTFMTTLKVETYGRLFRGHSVIPIRYPGHRPKPSFEPGDSGSWVFSLDGHWYGMAFAEIDIGNQLPIYAFLSAQSIIQDIEKTTGLRVIEPQRQQSPATMTLPIR